CVTGLSSRHVGERFQCSPDTITKYFKSMLVFFLLDLFYTSQIKFPTATTPVADVILNNP
ncbi:hypothetical protein BDN67DRAFT_866066, partial [Paxillus ammoniavirescens]